MCQIKISLFNVGNVTSYQKVIRFSHFSDYDWNHHKWNGVSVFWNQNSVFVVVVLILHGSKSGVKWHSMLCHNWLKIAKLWYTFYWHTLWIHHYWHPQTVSVGTAGVCKDYHMSALQILLYLLLKKRIGKIAFTYIGLPPSIFNTLSHTYTYRLLGSGQPIRNLYFFCLIITIKMLQQHKQGPGVQFRNSN